LVFYQKQSPYLMTIFYYTNPQPLNQMIAINELVKSNNILTDIVNAQAFYFEKGQHVLQQWLDLEVKEDLKNELLRLSADYRALQSLAGANHYIHQCMELLYSIISYCDDKAKDKHLYNQYEDKRTIAMAFVRMNTWVDKLIKFKFDRNAVERGSPKNAMEYLLSPQNNATILSENHRKEVAQNLLKKEYRPGTFVDDIQIFFSPYQLLTTHPDNYTLLLSKILYCIEMDWKDGVIGLMASDNTGWQDGYMEQLRGYGAGVVWNSKRPSGTKDTIDFLRNIIEEGNTFYYYYSAGGVVNYRATVIDFAENDEQLVEKKWPAKYPVFAYEENMASYKDETKTAKIVFLIKSLEKLVPVALNDFKFYKGYEPPRQDNLSPVKAEPANIYIQTPFFSNPVIAPETKKTIMDRSSHPLNLLMFGPPGTGKTYNSINKAVAIISTGTMLRTRKEIKSLYDQLAMKNKIFFTTFHQSMSYEDFIEGIKPILSDPDTQKVNYRIEDGIFKRACAVAGYESYKLFVENEKKDSAYSFDDMYESFLASIQKQLDAQQPPVYKALNNRAVTIKEINSQDSIIIRSKRNSEKKSARLTKENIKKLYDRFESIDEITDIAQVEDIIQVTGKFQQFYAIFSALKEFEKDYEPGEDSSAEDEEDKDIEDKVDEFNEGAYKQAILQYGRKAAPVVLIIDEINRGNVSQVFGELITLIEGDKRLGGDESLEVILPYSKKLFSVPPNLYIIGTMNTADRSVEGLDTALRRRFVFEEIPPQEDLIFNKLTEAYVTKFKEMWANDYEDPQWLAYEGPFLTLITDQYAYKKINRDDLKSNIQQDENNGGYENAKQLFITSNIQFYPCEIMRVINRRLEKLLDKDHKIGHSYFMDINSFEELKPIFFTKIIPLLQEYFFGDFGKIGLVIGKGFFEEVENTDENIFAEFEHYDGGDYIEKTVFTIRKPGTMNDQDFGNAIQLLLKK